jgi:hypothetical protein
MHDGLAALLRLDHVSNAKPQRLFVWRRFILASTGAAKADYRRQVLAHAVAIQTLAKVRIKNGLIVAANAAVN